MMITVQKMIPLAVLASVVFFAIGIIAAANFLRQPHAFRILAASSIGAGFEGIDGVTLQTSNTNCGAAVLKMIFDHYGMPMSLKEIETDAGFSEKGVSMLSLKRIARNTGLTADGWRLTFEDFGHRRFPAILYVSDNHFIVADSVRFDEIYIRDPAIGRLTVNRKSLMNIWKGETLLFSRE